MKENPSNTKNSLAALPVPTGRHCIGTAKYDLEDVYRKDFQFPQGRLVPIQIYFPLQQGSHSEEREAYQKETGSYEQMARAGHKVCYYKGSTHISFMDHAYVNPQRHMDLKEEYFNGTLEERKVFFETVRKDVRNFLYESGV